MDLHLRNLLRRYAMEPTPENAVAYANASLRVDPPLVPTPDTPLSIDQLIDMAKGTEALNEGGVEFSVIVSLGLDDIIAPDYHSNGYEYFWDNLGEAAVGTPYAQQLSYVVLGSDPDGGILFKVDGFIEFDDRVELTRRYIECPVCESVNILIDGIEGECRDCGFYWSQPEQS